VSESLVCGLIGAGITKSLTPPMHEEEGRHHGLRYAYRIIDLRELGLSVADLPRLVRSARDLGFRGLNITYPCKEEVIECLDDLSPDAARLGAINTVLFEDGRAIGHNTDWSGYARNFDRGLEGAAMDRVVQVGAGGAGVAVAYALLTRGAQRLIVVDADLQRAQQLRNRLAASFDGDRIEIAGLADLPDVLRLADGVVNATPMGMAAHPGSAVPAELLRPDLWVSEVVYRPVDTELLRAARAVGARTLRGTGMAVYQAVDAFRIFTGIEADADRMFEHMTALVAREESVVAR